MQLEHQRGQTLPFWGIGTVVVLAMLFFLSNYVNVMTWNVRAQNAADSFATQALGVQSNLYNEYSVLTYAASVSEYRLRYLNQAILNTINGVGGCNPAPGGSCDQDYAALVQQYNTALAAHDKLVQLMRQGDNMTQAGVTSDQKKAEKAMGGNCTIPSDYTCSFTPTIVSEASINTSKAPDEVDVVACHKVPYYVPQLLRLASGASFSAMGRSAAAIVPGGVQVFNPGTSVNSITGHVFQPVEMPAPDTYAAYAVDFSGMNATVNWYIAGPIRPFGGAIAAGSYGC